MPFVERDQEIEAFPPDGPDESLAEGVRLGRVKGCLQDPHSHRPHRRIESRGVDAVPVVDHEPIGLLSGDGFAELLQGPVGRRMGGHVAVNDATRSHFQDHENGELITYVAVGSGEGVAYGTRLDNSKEW